MSSEDRVLDWVSRHDPKSKNFGVSTVVSSASREKKLWREGAVLDQGREGACVGFGWTAELLASPRPSKISETAANPFARTTYKEAQRIDEWDGESYEGTSVLAGAKVIQGKGYIESYRWAFGIDQVIDALVTLGPVVIGIPWYDSMYETRRSGLVEIGGRLVGGHCLTLTGYHPSARLRGEDWHARFEVVRWRNSWGLDYGNKGSGWIKVDDLARLLDDQGEACVPIGRKQVKI